MGAYPFVVGGEYGRSALLEFVGSKQGQSGVLWGAREPGCVICTSGGRHGKKAGYFDQPMADGSWIYYGQGSTGDQDLKNSANSKLAARERSVLLFTTREPTAKEVRLAGSYGKRFTFEGSFVVAAIEEDVPKAGPRKGNRLYRFRLVREGDQFNPLAVGGDQDDAGADSLMQLQNKLVAENSTLPAIFAGVTEYRQRSRAVQKYALLRAGGCCELCGQLAPFVCPDNTPFLEVHHQQRLADDGLDLPQNVAALCPNCHRAVHLALNKVALRLRLLDKIKSKEQQIASGCTLEAPIIP